MFKLLLVADGALVLIVGVKLDGEKAATYPADKLARRNFIVIIIIISFSQH
jgi:hypothetical protein